MKLTEKLGLTPEQKEHLLEELVAEKTVLNVQSFLRLTSINQRISRITAALAPLKGEEYEKALKAVQSEMDEIEELVKQQNK